MKTQITRHTQDLQAIPLKCGIMVTGKVLKRDEVKIILQTKKALLFSEGKTWTKKGRRSFDVSMGSWDGAEVADLVGLYMLSQLNHLILDYTEMMASASQPYPQD